MYHQVHKQQLKNHKDQLVLSNLLFQELLKKITLKNDLYYKYYKSSSHFISMLACKTFIKYSCWFICSS